MGTFSGRQHKGAQRDAKAQRRREAEVRDEEAAAARSEATVEKLVDDLLVEASDPADHAPIDRPAKPKRESAKSKRNRERKAK